MKELEEIIVEVDGHGKYQKRLLYLILVPLYFFQAMACMNELFDLAIPQHWCNHPMTAGLNKTELVEWKGCHVPRKETDGSFDTCAIVLPKGQSEWKPGNISTDIICPTQILKENGANDSRINRTSCNWGWSFDNKDFSRTVVTDNRWYCNDSSYVPNLYTLGKVGAMFGTLVFNYFGDRFGRRYVFWFVMGAAVTFMTAKTFVSEYYYAYATMKFLGATAFNPVYQLPFSIICEVSESNYRAWAILITWVVWYVVL